MNKDIKKDDINAPLSISKREKIRVVYAHLFSTLRGEASDW